MQEKKKSKILTLRVMVQKRPNQFCPRCGVVVPPDTKCIPSPTHQDVEYHVSCFYALAQQIGCPVQVA
jgi:hypothetical protein